MTKFKKPMAKIKMASQDYKLLEKICKKISDLCDRLKVTYNGPVRMPTKHCVVPVRKSPDGEGVETWDRWELRVHKRLMYVAEDDRILKRIFKIIGIDGIQVEVKLSSRG